MPSNRVVVAGIPDEVGGHKVIRELGRGAMGVVYLAFHEALQRPLAIKVLLTEEGDGPDSFERFRREGRIGASLRHPNIVQIFDFGEFGGKLYIVMEYLGSHTLQSLLKKRGPCSHGQTLKFADHILSALEHAHSLGIIHRDIKPSNVMVAANGEAVLTDFSVSHSLTSSKLTQAGAAVGTPEYMSPEQFEGRFDHRSDLYSVAALIYELLTGLGPFHGVTLGEVMKKQMFVNPEPLDSINFTISSKLAGAVQLGLAKKPEDRFQSAREFRQALKCLAEVAPIKAEARPSGNTAPAVVNLDVLSQAGEPTSKSAPALIVYLLNVSESMGEPLFGGSPKAEAVATALHQSILKMEYLSKEQPGSSSFRLAIFTYNHEVEDALEGVKDISYVAGLGRPSFDSWGRTDSAAAFQAAEKLITQELESGYNGPPPLVCHVTDGVYTGEDPLLVARRLKKLAKPVLLLNIFVAPDLLREPIHDVRSWGGVTRQTRFADSANGRYADWLKEMSSPIPSDLRRSMVESGYSLEEDALMMFPGVSQEFVSMAFDLAAFPRQLG